MTDNSHRYVTHLEWTGNRGNGTSGYRDYGRDHVHRAPGKPDSPGSSDASFRGDAARWNPEDLLVASLSACHQLWYLHLCSVGGIIVTAYTDQAEGSMTVGPDGGGEFTSVMLRPHVTISTGDPAKARELHHEAHRLCFIARSANFPVNCEPTIEVTA